MKVTVGKSQALYSSVTRRGRDKNSGLLTIGAVAVDIPQHPVALHGMMTRGSKQLSSTLQVKPTCQQNKSCFVKSQKCTFKFSKETKDRGSEIDSFNYYCPKYNHMITRTVALTVSKCLPKFPPSIT